MLESDREGGRASKWVSALLCSRKGCWGKLSWGSHGAGLPKSMSRSVPSQGRCLTLSLTGPVKVFQAGWAVGSTRSTGGGWCRRSGGLRRRCRCACRGGTRHPHRGPPALPAAPARAPCPGRGPQPRGAAPRLAWHVGTWWEARSCVVVCRGINPCSPLGLVSPGSVAGA